LKSTYLPIFFALWCRKRKRFKSLVKTYVYKYDRPLTYRRWLKFNKRFVSIRLTRLYFINLQDHQFRKLFRTAAKLDGNFESNYLRFLEGRLISIVYRLNLSANIFWLFKFVSGSNVFLNFKSVSIVNFIVPIGQLLPCALFGMVELPKIFFEELNIAHCYFLHLSICLVRIVFFFSFYFPIPNVII